jgi:MFS family permease
MKRPAIPRESNHVFRVSATQADPRQTEPLEHNSPSPSTLADDDRAAAGAWFAAGMFAVVALLSYTDRYILNLLLEPIRQALLLTDTQVSLAVGTGFASIYAFVGLPLGRLADRTNRRNLVIIGIIVWSAGTVGCALAGSFQSLIIGRIVVAVGEAGLAPAVFSMIADLFPPRLRGRALSLVMTGIVMGNAVSLLLGGALMGLAEAHAFSNWPWIGHLAPWRITLILVGLPGVIVACMVCAIAEPTRYGKSHEGAPPLRNFVRLIFVHRGRLATLYLGLAMFGVADFAFTMWKPTLFIRQFAFSSSQVGLVLGSLALVAAVLGALSGGWFGDRAVAQGGAGERVRLVFLVACCFVPAAAFMGVRSAPLVLAAVTVWSLGGAIVSTTVMTSLQEQLPNEYRGLGSSVSAFLGILLGIGLGPTLVGLATQYLYRAPNMVGWSMVTVMVPAGAFAIFAFRHSAKNS